MIRPLAIVILLVGVVLGQNDSTALDDDLKDERKKYRDEIYSLYVVG